MAKQQPRRVSEYRYRPPRIWVTEADASERGGVKAVHSRHKDKTATGLVYVTDEGFARARAEAGTKRRAR